MTMAKAKHLMYRDHEYVTRCGASVSSDNKPTKDISKVTCKNCKQLHEGTHRSQSKRR